MLHAYMGMRAHDKVLETRKERFFASKIGFEWIPHHLGTTPIPYFRLYNAWHFFNLDFPLGSIIPHITTKIFKISSFSSHIPWTSTALTSTIFINFESILPATNFDTNEELDDNPERGSC